jgi:hypothetical protein
MTPGLFSMTALRPSTVFVFVATDRSTRRSHVVA